MNIYFLLLLSLHNESYKMEKQEQQEENKESFNDNINRRAEALRVADLNGGVAGLFKKKLF